jgi:chromosomal replication initiator protein
LIAAQRKHVSWAAIEQAVCDVCGVSQAELKSPKRSEHVSVARNLAMWLSRKHIGVAFADIGLHYGGRSHSTVISANKKVTGWLQNGDRVRLGSRGTYPVDHAVREIETRLKIG